MVPEMQEIDEFFDSLNPYIEVIWGISTDNSIGEDAKVTILATGMEDNEEMDEELKDDAYYESLIPQLYRPVKEKTEEQVAEPDFVVEPAPEPEPPIKKEEPKPEPTFWEKIKEWLTNMLRETEE